MTVERNFLFGLTALRSGLIDARQLAEAGTEWMEHPERSLAEVLTAKGWLSESIRSTLEERVLHDMEEPTTGPADHENGSAAGTTIIFAPESTDGQTSPSDQSTEEYLSGIELLKRADQGRADSADRGFGPRYRVIQLHATGGIGRVWKVFDRILQRDVALKELRPDRSRNGFDERRFLEEARITAGLDHPNIVPAYDLAEWGVRPFYTMRFIQGDRTLKDAVRQYHRQLKHPDPKAEPMDLRRLLDHFLMVCNGIDYAHSRGVIHRDLKGQNVVLGAFGETFVLDWGLARRLDSAEDPLAKPPEGFDPGGDGTLTVDGYPIGTPNYMSPEQARGDRAQIGKRSDVFGLGTLLYLILTSRPVYDGGESTAVIAKAVLGKIEPPSKLAPNVPPALESICMRALSPDPEDRYPSAKAMSEDVRRWLDDEPVEVHPEPVLVKTGRWTRKNPAKVAAVGAILTTAVVALGIGAWRLGIASQEVQAANLVANEATRLAVKDLIDSEAVLRESLVIMQRDLPNVKDEAADRARLHMAEAVLPHYRKLAGRHLDNPMLQEYIASGLRESAKVHQLMYRLEKSEQIYREAIAVVDQVSKSMETAVAANDLGIELRVALAELIALRGDPSRAMPVIQEAVSRAKQMVTAYPTAPSMKRTEGRALAALASITYQNGDPAAAATLYEESRQHFQGLPTTPKTKWDDTLFEVITTLGSGYARSRSDQQDAATTALNESNRLVEDLLALTPNHNDALYLQACIDLERARQMTPSGEAQALLEQAHEILKDLAAVRSSVLDYRQTLAIAKQRLAAFKTPSALRAEAQSLLDDVIAEAPEVPQAYALRASLLTERANEAIDRGDVAEAQTWTAEAARDLEVATARNPRNPEDDDTRKALDSLRQRLDAVPAK